MPIWDDLLGDEDRKAYDTFVDDREVGAGVRPALLICDMTNAFVDERWSTGCGDSARECVRNVVELLAIARQAGVPIAYSRGNRWGSKAELGRWKSGGPRLLDLSAAELDPNAIYPAVAPAEGDAVVVKSKPSMFFGTHLSSVLNYHEVDTVVVAGLVTSGCVRATVVDAFSYNYRVVVPEEAVADRSPLSHKVNLLDMAVRYADIVSLDWTKQYLGAARR